MSALARALACGVIAVALGANQARAAGADGAGDAQVLLEARHERVDGGMDDWHGIRLGVASVGAWTQAWRAALVRESRFGLVDAGMELGGSVPLDDRWLVQADVAFAPDAGFLPEWTADIGLVRRLEGGWLLVGSLGRAEYRSGAVDRGAVGVERYAGQWRVVYEHDLARLGRHHLGSHSVSLDRYYGDRNVVGLRVAAGEEAVQQADTTLSPRRTNALWVRGTHWTGRAWAIDWAVGHVSQRAAYDRDWIQLGIRREF